MKKKTRKAFGIWFFILLLFFMTAFWNGKWMMITGALLWAVIPFASAGMNLYIQKKLLMEVSVPNVISKRGKVAGTIVVKKNSILPCAGLFCEITVENRLTGEKEKSILEFEKMAVGDNTKQYEISSDHCGYLLVYPSGVWLMDWIGFLPVRCRNIEQKLMRVRGEKNGVAVLPDTFRTHIYLHKARAEQEDAEQWSQTQKGNDYSEVFALREYVSGDDIKRINWKLSSKRGQLIVRETSLPVENSLLLFWDKNTEKAKPEEMDAMAECAASVSQEMLNQGYRFTLGWTEGERTVFEEIENEDVLLQTIPRMVKHGSVTEKAIEKYDGETGTAMQFGKVIYLAKTVGEYTEYFSCTDRSFLLCGAADAEDDRIISFRAEKYQEDLAAIEL